MIALIFPILAYLLFIAHLYFHGLTLWILLPILLIAVLFVPSRIVLRVQQIALAGFAAEWLYTGWQMYERRIAMGQPWHVGVSIMAGCAAFTLLCALVFQVPSVKRHYSSWKSGS